MHYLLPALDVKCWGWDKFHFSFLECCVKLYSHTPSFMALLACYMPPPPPPLCVSQVCKSKCVNWSLLAFVQKCMPPPFELFTNNELWVSLENWHSLPCNLPPPPGNKYNILSLYLGSRLFIHASHISTIYKTNCVVILRENHNKCPLIWVA